MSDITPCIIPTDIAEFISNTIGSVMELEAVLIFRENRQIRWSAQTLASRLYVRASTAQELLQLLCRSGFVAEEAAPPPLYRYNPGSPDIREKTDRLASLCSTHLIAVTRLIHSKSGQRVRGFPRTFKFRGHTRLRFRLQR
jgi:hypothetical protein